MHSRSQFTRVLVQIDWAKQQFQQAVRTAKLTIAQAIPTLSTLAKEVDEYRQGVQHRGVIPIIYAVEGWRVQFEQGRWYFRPANPAVLGDPAKRTRFDVALKVNGWLDCLENQIQAILPML